MVRQYCHEEPRNRKLLAPTKHILRTNHTGETMEIQLPITGVGQIHFINLSIMVIQRDEIGFCIEAANVKI